MKASGLWSDSALVLRHSPVPQGPFLDAAVMSARLLMIDDDARLSTMVGDYLKGAGYKVEVAGSLAQGRERLAAESYDALVLDLMLPDGDGLDLTRELRQNPRTRKLPLLMLTARGEPMDRIVRLEIDLGARVARLDGQACDLTSHQFDLLVVLAQSPGRVLSRDQIMDSLKGHPLEAFDRSIDVHISRIRSVIEDDPKAPRRVLTVRGAGYVFAKKQDADDAA
jgi:two-component system, OmpR family, phosphate regulon response regulator OmpR